ncbi:MAG: uroporphyrinogen decarboxylase [Defluviitaleaceae bacterium]|nr:uroporphyrinogen decarboxylase [Defluviitaleaceae bacterium]
MAIQFKKTDYIPYNASFNSGAHKNLVAYKGREYVNSINNHLTSAELNKPQVETKPGYYKDEFGVVWNKTGADRDIGVPDFWLIPDRESFETYEFPAVDEAYVRRTCEWLSSQSKSQFRGACIGFSLFERLWTMMGMENALSNMLLEPDLVHDALKKICEINLRKIDIAMEYDMDFFYFGDDWGQQKGLIMGPAHWNEFIRPYLGKMYARVRETGRFVAQHSCGDIRAIMDDLHALGLNVYQTFQPEIYGLDYADKLRGKIAIWGAISTQRDLPHKTPDEIRRITQDTLSRFKEGGGLIAAPTHSIPDDVPAENIVAMLDVLMNQ